MESSPSASRPFARLGVEEFLVGANADVPAWSVLDDAAARMLVVDLDDARRAVVAPVAMPLCPVVGIRLATGAVNNAATQDSSSPPAFVDLVVDNEQQLHAVVAVVSANPQASALLVQLLRNIDGVSVERGLFAESLAYSTLQHGAEFERWLGERVARKASGLLPEPAVRVARNSNQLLIRLNRPERRNAFSAEMRDLLCEALELARFDDSIERVHLSGEGVAFCAGGDLAEFGEARDASRAHLSRTTRSAGALLHLLRDRVRVEVHGACIGAGIELPAFAGAVHANADSFFQLPEVSLGLVPGAGGCVSLPRRIGRHRTAFMALSGACIDAAQALEWGLIDKIIGE